MTSFDRCAATGNPAESDPAVVLRFDHVSLIFAQDGGIRDLNFTVQRGEILGVTGQSGCGKTTLLRLACGLAKADTGRVAGNARRLGMVFQEPRLLPWLTALDNVRLVLPPQAASRAESALAEVGLAHAGDLHPAKLSGGMAQRVGIARALAIDPDLLLMDEPFANLDTFTRKDLLALVTRQAHERKLTTVFVSHDVRDIALICDQALVLRGRPGTIAGILDRPSPGGGRRRALLDFEQSILELIGGSGARSSIAPEIADSASGG
ncbi:aliphatic sulfonates import ATP-binding protein SsuB [mine drainage metagenome]|uniref:Aliphatic sulfonates import ATP-binding protein SsuB n=1 Tax=mine drainage metagenome TaxID=410659 RepID=A0A1J5PS92_9ZZZZ